MKIWIIIKTGFTLPVNEVGEQLGCEKWTPNIKRQIEVDAKATQTLQYGITKEELYRVGPFINAKDFWNKLVKLDEGTNDTEEPKQTSFMTLIAKEEVVEAESKSNHGYKSKSD